MLQSGNGQVYAYTAYSALFWSITTIIILECSLLGTPAVGH